MFNNEENGRKKNHTGSLSMMIGLIMIALAFNPSPEGLSLIIGLLLFAFGFLNTDWESTSSDDKGNDK